jgi:hypothetical protein
MPPAAHNPQRTIRLHRRSPAPLYALVLLAIIMLAPVAAAAQSSGVRVIANTAQLEAVPGQIVSATFRVINETADTREFEPSAELPAGWQLVSQFFPFTLEPGAEHLLFTAVAVPKYALADSYTVSIAVADTHAAGIADMAEVQIVVLPFANVEVLPEPGEYRILAGDEYTRTFTVANRSNATSRFRVSAEATPRWEITVEPREFTLAAGASQQVSVSVQTPLDVHKELPHRVVLRATALDLDFGRMQAQGAATTAVFPRTLTGEMHEALHGTYGFTFAWDDSGDAAMQARLDLDGSLGDGRHGEVYFVGPYLSRWSGQRFLEPDSFRVEYRDEARGGFRLGDGQLNVTPLTERYFYGRGLDAEVKGDPLSLRLFTAKRRDAWIPERISGAQLAAEPSDDWRFTLTALRREELDAPAYLNRGAADGSRASLAVEATPADGVELSGEFGAGKYDNGKGAGSQSGEGYRLAADVVRGGFNFSGELVRADSAFPGYWQDARLARAHFSVELARNLRLWGTLGDTQWNVAGDPTSASSRNRTRQAGLSFPAGPLGRASVYRSWQLREDANLRRWDEREEAWNFQLYRDLGDLSLTGVAELGERDDRLTGGRRDLERYRLMFSASPTSAATFAGGYSWHTEQEFASGAHVDSDQFWLDADLRLNRASYLRLGYSRNGGYGATYDWLRAELGYDAGGPQLKLKALRRGGALGGETALGLDVLFPLTVPVSWLPTSGAAEGRIYHRDGMEVPLAGVVVIVDGSKVATDAGGRFRFPTLPAGEYELRLERSTLGFALVPDVPQPLKFTVQPGKTAQLDIPVVAAASVSGRVVFKPHGNGEPIPEDASIGLNNLPRGGPPPAPGAPGSYPAAVSGVTVTLSGEMGTFTQVTTADGSFSFADLRPGQWTLSVAPEQLPEYCALAPMKFALELTPGETAEDYTFVLSPAPREIIITAHSGA